MRIFFISTIALATLFFEAEGSHLPELLVNYYAIKDALTNDDAAAASKNAASFVQTIEEIDAKALSAGEVKTFLALKDKLSYDARHISEVQYISHQREHFASLSLNMYQLAKAVKLSSQPVYKDYCPMKKAYWLSGDAAIKNPYFGKQMLTCGNI